MYGDTEIIAQYELHLRASGRTHATIEQRKQWIRRLSREMQTPLLEHTATTLTNWLAHPSWGKSTRRSARASLLSFYQWATRNNLIEEDPSQFLETIREPPPCPRPVPEDVFGRALANAGPREHLAILLAGCCGLRASEVVSVHIDDIGSDMYGDVLAVHGKGERLRLIPVGSEVTNALAVAFRESPYGWAFPNMNDMTKHVQGAAISRNCRPYLEGHTFHALRHRYASRVYETSGDLLSTQQLLGHASPVTTQRYVAVDRVRLRNAARGAA